MKLVPVIIAIVISSNAAFAGNIAIAPPATAAITAPADSDWSGIYGGAYYSFATGTDVDDFGEWELTGDGFSGGFVGYRHDFGKMVVGAELATTFDVNLYEEAFPSWAWSNFSDAKATLGYDLGRALVFASVGYTYAEMSVEENGVPPTLAYNGWNAGVGVDFMLTDKIFVGAEYVFRSLESDDFGTLTSEIQSLQVRAGLAF